MGGVGAKLFGVLLQYDILTDLEIRHSFLQLSLQQSSIHVVPISFLSCGMTKFLNLSEEQIICVFNDI